MLQEQTLDQHESFYLLFFQDFFDSRKSHVPRKLSESIQRPQLECSESIALLYLPDSDSEVHDADSTDITRGRPGTNLFTLYDYTFLQSDKYGRPAAAGGRPPGRAALMTRMIVVGDNLLLE
jgi:hypothetical protein